MNNKLSFIKKTSQEIVFLDTEINMKKFELKEDQYILVTK